MSTFTNTAREVEMPNGDVVVIHNAPTGGENTTSNIKKFKYDDNGHVTESTAADAEDLNLSGYSTPTTGTTAIGASDDVQTAIGKLDHQSQIDQTNILYSQINAEFNADTIGWYRIFELGTVLDAAARGATDSSCRLIIKRSFSYNPNEHHEISLLSVYEQISFGVETSKTHSAGGSFLLTKIRCVYTSTNAYIDVYYAGSQSNTLCCMLTENYGLCPWKVMDTITTVPETTSGETVAVTYEFQPNVDLTQGLAELNAHPFLTVPINHNMVYRGKNLGDTLTDAQHTALSGGNFTDLYLGDYWTKSVTIPAFYEVTTSEPSDWSTNYTSYYTKSGDTYTPVSGDTAPTWAANTYYERSVPAQTVTLKAVIADFDTFYAGYASSYAAINTHHAAVIVTGFGNVVWNKTNTTAGGYVNSLIHKWLVNSVLPQIETWFSSAKVLSHQKLLTNAITGDAASNWAWSSQKISLLSENQMYGSKVWGGSKAANGGYEPGEAFKHLNVFNHIDANLLFGNKNIWLRDIASAGWVAGLFRIGYAGSGDASGAGFAPAALILLS